MTSPALLEVNSIAKSFRGLRVLNDVSFAVGEGALVGLIGPNGAGKSTLFNIVTGFLAADQGRVRFQGAEVNRRSVQQRCRLGIVRTFQTPKVFQQLSVLENLMIGSYIHTRSGLIGNMLRSPATGADRAIMRAGAERALYRAGASNTWLYPLIDSAEE